MGSVKEYTTSRLLSWQFQVAMYPFYRAHQTQLEHALSVQYELPSQTRGQHQDTPSRQKDEVKKPKKTKVID